jgi:hypothetical protein
MGKAACLVILPDQLVGRIIHVGRGIGAVADGGDIAITVLNTNALRGDSPLLEHISVQDFTLSLIISQLLTPFGTSC